MVGRHLLAVALACTLILALLAIMTYDGIGNIAPPETVVMRQVQLARPPPPPPPPTVRKSSQSESMPTLDSTAANVPVELKNMNLNVQLQAGLADLSATSGFRNNGLGEDFGMDWGTVELSELDGIPTFLNQPVLKRYPKALTDQKIYQFEVRFHVVIDEQGVVHVLDVLSTEYPQYNSLAIDFAELVRFTVPTRMGIPVKTEYTWNVILGVPPP